MQVNQRDLVERLAHGLIFTISNRFPYANLLMGDAIFSGHRSLPVDFDIVFAAATGNCEHDANADCDNYSDQCPCHTDAGQNTHFPERGDKATNQDNITNKINTCPLHNKPPDEIRPLSYKN